MYSRSSSGGNELWQSPYNRRPSNFDTIWSNHSSISSGTGVTFDELNNQFQSNVSQTPMQQQNQQPQPPLYGQALSPYQSNDSDAGGGRVPQNGFGLYTPPAPVDGFLFDQQWHDNRNYNVWDTQGRGRGSFSAPGQQPPQNPLQQQPPVSAPSASLQSNPQWFEHRRSFNSFSPTAEMPDFRFDLNRRHSVGDVHYMDPAKSNAGQSTGGGDDTRNRTLELINDYFNTDPHKRIKVTLQLLEDNFFDDNSYNIEGLQLPKFPIENSLRNYQLLLVGFKAGRIDVFYLPNNHELGRLQVGDLVFVEADRGRDLGKVAKLNLSIDEARLLKFLHFQEQQQALNDNTEELNLQFNHTSTSPPQLHFPKPVISLAQPSEVMKILNKKLDEEKACRLCLAKITNMNYLNSNDMNDLVNMKLIDAEYQFDRNKLIFYYSTNKRIDFRDLVRELFRIYKTRIWMCAVIGIPFSSTSTSSPPQQVSSNATSSPVFSMNFQSPSSKEVPRHLAQPPQKDEDEKFMLKSLVDQINH